MAPVNQRAPGRQVATVAFADWAQLTREQLNERLSGAVVLLPLGATEQHGPQLATGTDHLIAQAVARSAGERAGSRTEVLLAPTIAIGASDHHLGFGGTLSVTASVLHAYLLDVLTSIASAGGARVLIVNGHGGNSGICHAVAAEASAARAPGRAIALAAHVDYWTLVDPGLTPDSWPVPGHAGAFETSLLMALTDKQNPPDLAALPPRHDPTPPQRRPGRPALSVHGAGPWAEIDGYTDHPDRADAKIGARVLDHVVAALAEHVVELAHLPVVGRPQAGERPENPS